MKVSIGSKIIDGPWGGGNLFVVNLKEFLIKNGHKVIHNLSEKDIDIILLTDPRSRKESSSTFNHKDVLEYIKYINPNTSVIQRINECDERKGTKHINQFYLEASNCSHHIVFVSDWLREIYLNLGLSKLKTSVIMSGADKNIFNQSNLAKFNRKKIKFVTHHWSSHKNKGFDIYLKFDNLLDKPEYKNLEFTYIGNVPKDLNFKNIKVSEPLAGFELASKIKENNIYITASKFEPSGNHHIEAAQCGLPILYYQSGGIPEYCEGYGIPFNDENFEEKLNLIIDNYFKIQLNLINYPFSADLMCEEYLEKFYEVLSKNDSMNKRNNIFLANLFLVKNKLKYLFINITIKQYLILIYRNLFRRWI